MHVLLLCAVVASIKNSFESFVTFRIILLRCQQLQRLGTFYTMKLSAIIAVVAASVALASPAAVRSLALPGGSPS